MCPVSAFVETTSDLFVFQIDWPAPQDKKRECVAKGKNNQVLELLGQSFIRAALFISLRSITFSQVNLRFQAGKCPVITLAHREVHLGCRV